MTTAPSLPEVRTADHHEEIRTAIALAHSQMPRDRRHLDLTPDGARARLRADYLELPRLTLTVAQAARLWSLGYDLALIVLEELATAGFLVRRDDRYARP